MTKPNYLYKNNRLILKIMRQNIKNNSKRAIDAKLYTGKYYDFMLFKGSVNKYGKQYIDSLSIADFSSLNLKDGILYSDVVWNNAVNEGVELLDVGLTGVDNGLISFRKDRITNEKFLELYLNSTMKIESGDTRFFMTPVTGNTLEYIYPLYLNDGDEKYISCKGGFYQGFFKLYGHKYQVLPDNLNKDIVLHFELRPRTDYEIDKYTINYNHSNNKGIFFFIGTRAENKFWPFYKTNSNVIKNFKKINAQFEGYFSGCKDSGTTYDVNENNVVFLENQWLKEEPEETKIDGYFAVGDSYFNFDDSMFEKTTIKINKENFIVSKDESYFNTGKNSLNTYDFNSYGACYSNTSSDYNQVNISTSCCENYFNDGYYDNRCPEYDNNKSIEDKFIGEGIEIDKKGNYIDSVGHEINKRGHIDIVTDNKFLMFDRTASGFTTKNWVEGTKVTLTDRRSWPNANYFLLMNRTKTGYTAHNIENYSENNSYDYNLFKDIRNNVFALRITDTGAIGYRYGVFDCDSENKYSVIEEYSKDNIIKFDTWNKINVRFTALTGNKMRIMIYANGYLVFVSKELDAFNFKELNEIYQKQETVPYNISLGGGSLGLMETILPNYYAIPEYILPIEKDFCGSFLGDIKTFKIYEGFIDYSSITNYLS